jgi:hypothetical protein
MTRDDALELITTTLALDENLRRHMLATEAVMRALAERLGHDPDRWGLAGLVHDCDLGTTAADPDRHGRVAAAMLREAGVAEEVCRAVEVHPGRPGDPPVAPLEVALRAADQVTGLVTAAALIHPTKSIAALKVSSLRKRMKEKRFAAGVDREAIATCEALGLSLDDFLQIAAEAMDRIAGALGLDGRLAAGGRPTTE